MNNVYQLNSFSKGKLEVAVTPENQRSEEGYYIGVPRLGDSLETLIISTVENNKSARRPVFMDIDIGPAGELVNGLQTLACIDSRILITFLYREDDIVTVCLTKILVEGESVVRELVKMTLHYKKDIRQLVQYICSAL